MKCNCPICGKAVDSERDKEFPFCSERCRTTDLGNWASERYRIPGPPVQAEPPASEETENEPKRGKSEQ
jgi:endogenous inhibitor of DNA gyrase (YacG/DUF329 family)